MQTLNKSTTPAIDPALFEKLLAVPSIQAAFAEATASDEATAAAQRKAVLDAKAAAERELADLTSQDTDLEVAIAQLAEEISSMKRERYTVMIALQRANFRRRDHELALRDQHGGRLITHVSNYLLNTARNAELEAERQATLKTPSGKNFMGDHIMKPDPKAQAKAAEQRDAAIGLREAADTIEALAVEAISPQEIRRRIQFQLERIGLTLYTGDLPEHMISRQVHAQGPGQQRAVELLAPKVAA